MVPCILHREKANEYKNDSGYRDFKIAYNNTNKVVLAGTTLFVIYFPYFSSKKAYNSVQYL
jgi:hypothetical protein